MEKGMKLCMLGVEENKKVCILRVGNSVWSEPFTKRLSPRVKEMTLCGCGICWEKWMMVWLTSVEYLYLKLSSFIFLSWFWNLLVKRKGDLGCSCCYFCYCYCYYSIVIFIIFILCFVRCREQSVSMGWCLYYLPTPLPRIQQNLPHRCICHNRCW